MNARAKLALGSKRTLTVLAWLNLVGNVLIIGTGGAVRLTASGLGCPTWPQCSSSSWVPTSELSWHSIIEFSNRMMSPILGILALLLVLSAWQVRHERRQVWVLSLVVLGGIVAQAVVGGITVITKLNAWIVGFHFLASIALVGVTAALLCQLRTQPHQPRIRIVTSRTAALTHVTSLVLFAVVVLGVITTASGPHSGDADVVRNSDNWSLAVAMHAIAGYLLFILTIGLLVFAAREAHRPLLRAAGALLAIESVQILVGIVQARIGIPPLLVGIHMVLSAISVATMVVVIYALKAPAEAVRKEADQLLPRETAH